MSGRILGTFSNPKGVRSMAVAFSSDSAEIMICCIDSSLCRQRLWEPEARIPIKWQLQNVPDRGRYQGTPRCASFSSDGSQIVVAFRQSPIASWSTQNGNLIGRCERARGKSKNTSGVTGYPLRLTWDPITEHVVGIYNDGAIFKWYPLDSEPEEMEEYITAAEIACSPDGRLIVAGQQDGSLKIFSFDNFGLLYRLWGTSAVTALTVSADGRRIYDLRKSYCNVWEPNVLSRMAEQDEMSSYELNSHYESTSAPLSLVSQTPAVSAEPVTAVCADVLTDTFAFGNDARVLICQRASPPLLDIPSLDRLQEVPVTPSLSIPQSPSPPPTQTSRMPILKAKPEDPLIQVLFDSTASYILGRCCSKLSLWQLSSPIPGVSRPSDREPCFWITHPFNPSCFLSIGHSVFMSYTTSTLSPVACWRINLDKVASAGLDAGATLSRRPSQAHGMSHSESEVAVERVLVAPNKDIVLVDGSKAGSSQGSRDIHFWLLDTDLLSNPSSLSAELSSSPSAVSLPDPELVARPLPKPIAAQILVALGFAVLEESRRTSRPALIWRLADIEGVHSKKHFFLPRDWINMDCLELALVTADGRLLCPRNGEVAVVHNGSRIE
ncbi:hypothetical protein NKR19_g3082 [Coniochaeta hoffmannii]|uniref:WD40 repeat-like protein n=1 Tax=Coniochaeta hoffmannii TaxID=91930 RepID=A0AA38RWQ9_9PEZI|nr:hypothetical protein NKR19_g3082 [Coniochaeta hoffmannii]